MIKRGLALSLVLGLGSVALGDAVIHVVPAPSSNAGHPAGTYNPDEVVDVELFLSQDSGAEHLVRLLTLHFDDTYADLGLGALVWEFGASGHYKDEDGAGGPPGFAIAYVGEGNCLDNGAPCNLAEGCASGAVCAPTVFKLGPLPASMLAVPGDGTTQVLVATLQVTMPSAVGGPYPLDAMNSDEADPDLCAAFSYGYGCAGACNSLHADADHAITFLRANTTGLTGGTYGFTVSGVPPVCGDGSIEGAEECDDNNTDPDDGCSATCAVEAGWSCSGEPSVCVRDCPALAAAVSSNPIDRHSLWRSKKNIIRITFDADVTVPAPGDIEIVECQPGCVEGPDQSGFFDISVEDPGAGPRVLRMMDTDLTATMGHLNHRSWYKVRRATWDCVDPFEYQFLVQIGDASDNNFVTNGDLGVINDNLGPVFGVDDSRFDIDGSNFITNGDLNVANDHLSGFVPNVCCP